VHALLWHALTGAERAAVTVAIERAGARRPLIWLTLEPGGDGGEPFELAARTWPGDERVLLARCGDHGPPVEWVGARLPAHGKGVSQLREGAGLRQQPQPLDGGDEAAL
jgi:hypothetical protein